MIELVCQRDASIQLKAACEAIGVPRATVYRYLRRSRSGSAPTRQRTPRRSPRRLTEPERQKIVEVLHSERFVDQTVRQVYAELLDEGTYIASVRSIYRILAMRNENHDRRNQRTPRHNAVPRLAATRPN